MSRTRDLVCAVAALSFGCKGPMAFVAHDQMTNGYVNGPSVYSQDTAPQKAMPVVSNSEPPSYKFTLTISGADKNGLDRVTYEVLYPSFPSESVERTTSLANRTTFSIEGVEIDASRSVLCAESPDQSNIDRENPEVAKLRVRLYEKPAPAGPVVTLTSAYCGVGVPQLGGLR